jgi:hypothetical protein
LRRRKLKQKTKENKEGREDYFFRQKAQEGKRERRKKKKEKKRERKKNRKDKKLSEVFGFDTHKKEG